MYKKHIPRHIIRSSDNAKEKNRRAYLYKDNWVTTEEICKLLSCSRITFYRWLREYNDNIDLMVSSKLGKSLFE
jgi:DNA invertase Pin-like site-specific DNA recombinase